MKYEMRSNDKLKELFKEESIVVTYKVQRICWLEYIELTRELKGKIPNGR